MITVNASSLHRIMACVGSYAMNAKPRERLPDNEAALEGDAAHEAVQRTFEGSLIPSYAKNGVTIDAEMIEHARAFRAIVPDLGTYSPWVEYQSDWLVTKDIEVKTRSDLVWLDCDPSSHHALVNGVALHVRDYKYGWRIVEPDENWQLIAGAIGAIRLMKIAPRSIVLGIYQPRPYHPDGPHRTVEYTLPELIALHDRIEARLTNLTDDLVTGEHCDRCPGAEHGECPAIIRAAHNAIDVAFRGGPAEVADAYLGYELSTIKRAAAVLEQRASWVEDIAKRKLKAGGVIPGYALEPQYGNRAFKDFDTFAKGQNVDLTVKKPVTPAEAVRRGISEETIAAATERPLIGSKLVKVDADKKVRAAQKRLTKTKPPA